MKAKDDEIAALKASNTALTTECNSLQTALTKARSETQVAEGLAAFANSATQSARDNLARFKEKCEDAKAKLKGELATVHAELDDARSRLSADQAHAVSQAAVERAARNAAHAAEVEQLRKDLTAQSGNAAQATADRQTMQTQLDDARTALAWTEDRVTELQRQLGDRVALIGPRADAIRGVLDGIAQQSADHKRIQQRLRDRFADIVAPLADDDPFP
jgi:chromosome segregation ATPase